MSSNNNGRVGNKIELELELQALETILDAEDPQKLDYRQRAIYSYLRQREDDSKHKSILVLLSNSKNFNKVVDYEDIIHAVWPGKEYAHPKEDITKIAPNARKMLAKISKMLGIEYSLISIPRIGYQLIASNEQ